MAKKKNKEEGANLVKIIVKAIEEKKGKDIVIMNLTNLKTPLCDYFVVCSGSSKTQTEAIADFIVNNIKKETKLKLKHKEGKENGEWILLDYFDVVVHVFQENIRSYYKLEQLWADADIEYIKSQE